MNNVYTNYFSGETGYGSSDNSDAFVKAVNKKTLCGAANWRMPTKDELMKLVVCVDGKYNSDGSCVNVDTTINTTYFPNIPNLQGSFYWSSSPYPNYPDGASGIYFGYSGYDNDFKGTGNFVRLVR